jgi:polysaccharide biosynthesis protein PslG
MRSARLLLIVSAIAASVAAGCARPAPVPRPTPAGAEPATGASGPFTKRLSFAVLEDYDKGEDLRDVARDFELMKELGVRTWRGSFGWDDYEAARGKYDFAWLHQFADLAAQHGIALRPYLGYTPEWAGAGRKADSAVWNDPPARLDDWARFVDTIARALRRHPNVLSYEIYNEENVKLWWDGTVAEYNDVLRRGATAVRAGDPDAAVLLGGMVWPDVDWLEATCATHANAPLIDVVPFHAYPETWTPDSVVVENYLDPSYARYFLPTVDGECGGKPVWINETGFATTPGKTERQQAEWWARAIATFVAAPRVEHIGIYEIRDAPQDRPVIGDAPNYHLGITRRDRTKKLAFHTVKLLTRLLGVDSVTVADAELTIAVTGGQRGALYHHLFRRPDGRQVLVVWDKRESPTLRIALGRRGATATEYSLDGAGTPYPAFDGQALTDVRLTPGAVRIFEITGRE